MKIYIPIPVHNRIDYTLKCIRCIKSQTYKNYEIIIIDDGSTDGTAQKIGEKWPDISILKGHGGLWWTGAMRIAIEYIMKRAHDNDFILCQNNDTVFDKDYLKILVSSSVKKNRIIVGTICKDYNDGKIIHTAPKISWDFFYTYSPELPKEPCDLLFDVDTLNTRGTLIPIEVFKEIGNFSGKLPHYGADQDFFYRAKKGGFALAVSYRAVTYSIDPAMPFHEKIISKNKKSLHDIFMLYFSRKSSMNLRKRTWLILRHAPWCSKVWLLLKNYCAAALFLYRNYIKKRPLRG